MSALLTPTEVADRLRLSRRTVVVWLQSGRLPGVKVGNRWRVKERDLRPYLETGEETPSDQAESVSWLEAKLADDLPAYDWGPAGAPHGKPVRYVPGTGLLIVEDDPVA